jgi:hypothetical protein
MSRASPAGAQRDLDAHRHEHAVAYADRHERGQIIEHARLAGAVRDLEAALVSTLSR